MEDPGSTQHVIGGLFALGAAVCWASASILFSRLGKGGVSSLGMNLGKGLAALPCIVVALALTGWPAPDRSWIWLAASGLVGITIGDTVFFRTLKRLGPRRTLLMTTLIPVCVALMSVGLLGERLPALGWVGAALCSAGVTWTMWERMDVGASGGSWRGGLGYGLLTVVSCAAAVILAKVGLSEASPMEATLVRLGAGVAGLLLLGLFRREVGSWLAPFRAPRLLGVLVIAAVVGTFLGIWFSMASLWYTTATVATVLGSMDPVFVLPLAALFAGEKVSFRAVLGALVAVAGVALLMTR